MARGIIIALAIFGGLHVAAYALAGFFFATTLFVNWSARRFKIKADMVRIYRGILEERFPRKPGA